MRGILFEEKRAKVVDRVIDCGTFAIEGFDQVAEVVGDKVDLEHSEPL